MLCCFYSFSRFAGILNDAAGTDLDLANGEYFVMFGVGEIPACKWAPHKTILCGYTSLIKPADFHVTVCGALEILVDCPIYYKCSKFLHDRLP